MYVTLKSLTSFEH